jgi:hypothetical protein
MADDLADRDLDPIVVSNDPLNDTMDDSEYEIADLFERAFETASLYNLDAMRTRAILENITYAQRSSYRMPPKIDFESMTAADRGIREADTHTTPPYADLTAELFPFPERNNLVPGRRLRYAEAAQFAHAKLCDLETLIDFLRSKPDRARKLVRPPFARFAELPKRKKSQPDPNYRDLRLERDNVHDMRMPPYMRDSDLNPLSITHRQHSALMQLITILSEPNLIANRADSPIARVIGDLLKQVAAKDMHPADKPSGSRRSKSKRSRAKR